MTITVKNFILRFEKVKLAKKKKKKTRSNLTTFQHLVKGSADHAKYYIYYLNLILLLGERTTFYDTRHKIALLTKIMDDDSQQTMHLRLYDLLSRPVTGGF
jgi:hypothetical protein